MGIERIETDRLVGERIALEHLEQLVAMDRDPRVMVTMGGRRSEEETRENLQRHVAHWDEEGFGIWAWRDRATGALVGRGGLRRFEIEGVPEVELGYSVVPERWGEGLATEMANASVRAGFDELAIPELVAFTLPSNVASRRVLEKAGFVYERDVELSALAHVLYRLRSPAAPG